MVEIQEIVLPSVEEVANYIIDELLESDVKYVLIDGENFDPFLEVGVLYNKLIDLLSRKDSLEITSTQLHITIKKVDDAYYIEIKNKHVKRVKCFIKK